MKNLAMMLSLVLVVGCVSLSGPVDKSSEIEAVQLSMDTRAAEFLLGPAVTSVSIGVHRNGRSYTAHYGELDPGEGNTPSDDTIYEIASVTKTFTGTLAAWAVLEGRLSLEGDVRDYLDQDFPNLEFEGKPIRIKHLITHTGGLPANNRPMEQVPDDNADGLHWKRLYEAERDYSKQEFFAHLRDTQIESEPGQSFLYSNVSANLMGHILENIYGRTFGELLKEKIFEQAGMAQTGLHISPEQQQRLARGYNGEGQPMPPLPLADVLWGAEGALKSTLPDMMKYAGFQLQENAVIRESHRRLHQLDDGYWVGYFWWVIDVEDDVVSFRHDGGAIGTRGVLIVYPEFDLATYVVTNNASPTIFPSLSELSEHLRNDLKP